MPDPLPARSDHVGELLCPSCVKLWEELIEHLSGVYVEAAQLLK